MSLWNVTFLQLPLRESSDSDIPPLSTPLPFTARTMKEARLLQVLQENIAVGAAVVVAVAVNVSSHIPQTAGLGPYEK